MATVPVEQDRGARVCTRCWLERPITEFRWRGRDSQNRHRWCRLCFNAYRRERNQALRRGEVRKIATRVSQSGMAAIPIASRMLARFGGLEAFCAEWWNAIDAAKKNGRHSTVLRSFSAIAKLIIESSKHQSKRPLAESTSDADLNAELEGLVIEILENNPTLVITAAARLGYTVIPPGEAR